MDNPLVQLGAAPTVRSGVRRVAEAAGAARQPAPVPTIATTHHREPSRRILLVSYHFPPDPAVGGVRWQKFSRFAAERGWGLDVLALHPAAIAVPDYGRLTDLPAGLEVYGIPPGRSRLLEGINVAWRALRPLRPGGTAGVPLSGAGSFPTSELRWFPRNRHDLTRAFHALTRYVLESRWAEAAARTGFGLIRPGLHQVVISSGPPHSAHLAARAIAERAGLPFVMDLRDPWRLVQRLPDDHASPLWMALAARGEGRCVRAADLVAVNTGPHGDALRALYPDLASRIITIFNGADDDDLPPRRPTRRFVVAYAGTVYLDRDPRPLFHAAARLIKRHHLTPDDFGVEFMGDVAVLDGVPLPAMADAAGIGDFVALHRAGSQAAARAFLAGAALLVVLPQDSTFAIPAKLFEYLRHEAWVLALAERHSAVEVLLRDTEADVVAPQDVEAITAILERRYLQHHGGGRPLPIARDDLFSRRRQAETLFEAIEDLVAGGKCRTGAARPRASWRRRHGA
ncbi:MAG: hypothetical protein ACREL2_00885 [Gemmatimonadales bacterium]